MNDFNQLITYTVATQMINTCTVSAYQTKTYQRAENRLFYSVNIILAITCINQFLGFCNKPSQTQKYKFDVLFR